MNSVAQEMPVIATGARPGITGGQRELFTEETTTVLVFENGGVLRLRAAVVPGQLLFLTNKESRREVVAQVTRKRDFNPTSCYVEVEFSEPSPGFWGVEFPETPQLAPATPQQKEAAEMVRTAKVISGKPSAPAPSVQEVAALKQEVEALREQLKLLQTHTASPHSAPPANLPAPANSNAPADASKPPFVPDLSQVPAIVGARSEPPPAQTAAIPNASSEPPSNLPSAAPATAPSESAIAPPASAALPIEPGGPSFSQEGHLPIPVIRINRANPANHSAKSKVNAGGNLRVKPLPIALLAAAALLAAFGAAWYFHWIPGLTQSTPASASAPATPAAQPTPVSSATPSMTTSGKNPAKLTSPSAAATPQPPANLPGTPSQSAGPDAQQLAEENAEPSPLAKPESPAIADAAVDQVTPQRSLKVAPSISNHSAPRASLKTASSSAALPSAGAASVPPKLIKSVRAIASPELLQYFDRDRTATVTLDAVVDTSGRVKMIKVISGPASLRNPAMDALKQYRYEPATLRGKPIAAHVTVAIKFLFEP